MKIISTLWMYGSIGTNNNLKANHKIFTIENITTQCCKKKKKVQLYSSTSFGVLVSLCSISYLTGHYQSAYNQSISH